MEPILVQFCTYQYLLGDYEALIIKY